MNPRFSLTCLLLLPAVFAIPAGGAAEGDIDIFTGTGVELAPAGEMKKANLLLPAGANNLVFSIPGQPGKGVLMPEVEPEPEPKLPDGKLAAAVLQRILAAGPEKEDGEKEKEGAAAPEKPKTPLSAEVDKNLREFVKEIAAAGRKQIQEDMQQTVRELTERIRPDDAAAAKLQALSLSAIDASMDNREEKYRDWLAPLLSQQGNPAETLQQWRQQPAEGWTSNNMVKGLVPPVQTEVWKNGLKEILTPEQQTIREAAEKERSKKILEECADWLATNEGRMATPLDQLMDIRLNRILQYGGVDEARKKELTEAAAAAVKNVTAAWRTQAEISLADTDEKFRKRLLKSEVGLNFDISEKNYLPQEQEVWKTAYDRILTEPERAGMEEHRRHSRTRRAVALTMSLLDVMDECVSFSETQYEKLLEL